VQRCSLNCIMFTGNGSLRLAQYEKKKLEQYTGKLYSLNLISFLVDLLDLLQIGF